MAATSEHMRQHLVDQREPGFELQTGEDPAETETEHECTRKVDSASQRTRQQDRREIHFPNPTGNRNGDSNLGTMAGLKRSHMSRPSKLRLILADDHPVLREGLSLILDLLPDMAMAGQASTGEEAFELFLKLVPDV
jgi:hypothetical protein